MKKTIILFLSLLVFASCKNNSKTNTESKVETPESTSKQTSNLKRLKGKFVFYDDAAVLQTRTDIYGVFITDKLKELNKLAEPYKNKPTDMVEVEIRGKITNQKDDKILWENKVEITEIISVKPESQDQKNVIKLGQE